jgi:type I restriction-modification system DNA methylase subunit/fido (protein-threonine AMPylation protein)
MAKNKIQQGLLSDVWITAGIFSNHYLLERLPQAGSTVWSSDEKVLPIYKVILELYEKNIVGLRKGNEANTERRFIDKVYNELGFGYLNQTKIPEAERRQVPDYFLYSTQKDAGKAFESSSHERYRLAISIAEAKRWDHNLDQPSSGKGKAPQGRYPHQQIRDYLNESEHIRWGILTNGKEWKLYFKEGRSSKFFEIDLEQCLKDFQKFKYFYTLFRPDAFIKDSSGKCLLDNILEQSLRFQEDVEKDLREKVFKCVEWLGQGFLFREENQLTEKDLDSIYHYSLILLYRILFVLNAEARDLLPTNPQTKYYKHYGIQRIKDRIRQEKGEFIGEKTTVYDDLLALFHLINGDNEKLNRDLKIPRYNGGLFDPERYSFLEEKKVGDDVLLEVIYELSYRTDKNGEEHSIDYKGLGERHLGTVYEGLLEHKFTFDNGKVVLKNDKGERKATGAYYTPDYIVKYIVENTLGPILKEIDKKISSSLPTLLKGGEGGLLKDDLFAHAVLKLNICDPAMGSGHFLVEAVQYLAEEIAYHPTTQLKTPKGEAGDEVNYWKRWVVESCIYGVDIKELAVELAKLSLWLKTVDRSQPLNFLDHHLRSGNSLIGARISDLNYLPQLKDKKKSDTIDEQLVLFDTFKFKEDITAIVKGFQSIEDMPSEKLSDIKAKDKTFKNLMEELNRYREIADLWTSLFFGNSLEEKGKEFKKIAPELMLQKGLYGEDKEINHGIGNSPFSLRERDRVRGKITNTLYRMIVMALQSKEVKNLFPKLKPLLENSESIAREKKFFHWEIEFPEVFFNEDGSQKENPGFDCVFGNPPYGILSKEWFYRNLYTFINPNWDIYVAFIERGFIFLKKSGYISYISPVSWETSVMFENIRSALLNESSIKKIVNLPFDVFKDAYIDTGIFVIQKNKNISNKALVFEFPKKAKVDKLDIINYYEIEQILWKNNRNQIILNPYAVIITQKLSQRSQKLGNITLSGRGVLASSEFLSSIKKEAYYPFFDGEMYRYEISNPDKFIYYSDDLPEKPSDINFFKGYRIFVRRLISRQDRIMATCVKDFFINKKDIYIFKVKDQNYSPYFILALLNSILFSFIYLSQETISKKDDFRQSTLDGIRNLPIPIISFVTPEQERKEKVDEAIKLYHSEIEAIALNVDKWQNKKKEDKDDKDRDKKGSAKSRKVAERPRKYKLPEEGISGEDPGLGGEVHGIREGAGEYKPPEGTSQEGEDSTRPLDSTRYFETAQGIKTYSEVSEILAVSVTKTIEAIIDQTPDDIHITPEWICKLHSDIAGALFSDWAGRFRDVNVTVGTHIPPPYYEVPVHTRLYCDDLTARLSFALKEKDIEKISETLAYADWRFQWIHPFKDFNGRIGRIILTAVLFKLKLPPAETASVEPEEKEKYLNALQAADKGDISMLAGIWIERLSNAFRETEGR